MSKCSWEVEGGGKRMSAPHVMIFPFPSLSFFLRAFFRCSGAAFVCCWLSLLHHFHLLLVGERTSTQSYHTIAAPQLAYQCDLALPLSTLVAPRQPQSCRDRSLVTMPSPSLASPCEAVLHRRHSSPAHHNERRSSCVGSFVVVATLVASRD